MEFASRRTSEDDNMKLKIATMTILAMIAASAFADFDSDVYFLTNGVLGGGREHVDRCIRGLRKRAGLNDDDLAERLLFVADAFAESTNKFQWKKGCSAIASVRLLATTNTLPRLERYIFSYPNYRFTAICAYADVSRCDSRYISLGNLLISNGLASVAQIEGRINSALARNLRDPGYLKPESKEGAIAFLLENPRYGEYDAPGYDDDMCKYYKPYVLSIERLRNIRQIADDTNVNWSVRERFSNEVVRLNAISVTNLLDLKSLGVINAETNVTVQSKAVREFLQRAKEEDERGRSREKTKVPKARWIQ